MRLQTLILLTIVLAACAAPPANFPTTPLIPDPSLPAVSTATSTPQPTETTIPQATATAQMVRLKIMPLGDSITFGDPDISYGSYRNLLWTLLTDDGCIVDFVGSQKSGKGIPDPDNEGHSGWKITNIKNGIDSEGWLETYQPDIILLHIGSNDIRHGYLTDAPANLSALLDDILLRLPQVHVIVAQIVPFSSGPTRGHRSYNDAIPAIAASKGPRVSMVDMQNVLSNGDFADSYHPTAEGYDKLARAWESAILAILPIEDNNQQDVSPCLHLAAPSWPGRDRAGTGEGVFAVTEGSRLSVPEMLRGTNAPQHGTTRFG